MSDRSAKLLLGVAQHLELPGACSSRGGPVYISGGLQSEILTWARGYREHISERVEASKIKRDMLDRLTQYLKPRGVPLGTAPVPPGQYLMSVDAEGKVEGLASINLVEASRLAMENQLDQEALQYAKQFMEERQWNPT